MGAEHPSIDDVDLLKYLDGEAEPQVGEHLKNCPDCQKRVADLVRIQRQLSSAFFRRDCPSSEELGEFYLRMHPRERMQAIRLHLEGCPHCRRELDQLQSFLKEVGGDLEYSLGDRLEVLVAQWVSGPAAGSAPALQGLRGREQAALVCEAGEFQVSLEVQGGAADPSSYTVAGLFVGAQGEEWMAHLFQGPRLVQSQPVDEIGNFVFERIPEGRYELSLRSPGREIRCPEFTVSG